MAIAIISISPSKLNISVPGLSDPYKRVFFIIIATATFLRPKSLILCLNRLSFAFYKD